MRAPYLYYPLSGPCTHSSDEDNQPANEVGDTVEQRGRFICLYPVVYYKQRRTLKKFRSHYAVSCNNNKDVDSDLILNTKLLSSKTAILIFFQLPDC